MQRQDDSTAVLIAYCKLAEAVIYSAVRPEMYFKSTVEKIKSINRNFAHRSKLIQHYADVFKLDEVRVRKAIIEANK